MKEEITQEIDQTQNHEPENGIATIEFKIDQFENVNPKIDVEKKIDVVPDKTIEPDVKIISETDKELNIGKKQDVFLKKTDKVIQSGDDSIWVNKKETINCKMVKVHHPDPEIQNLINSLENGTAYSLEIRNGQTSEEKEIDESGERNNIYQSQKPIEQLHSEDLVEQYEYEDHCIFVNNSKIINCKYYDVRHPDPELQQMIYDIASGVFDRQTITSKKVDDLEIKEDQEITSPYRPTIHDTVGKISDWKINVEQLLEEVKLKETVFKNIKKNKEEYSVVDDRPIIDADSPITAFELVRKERKWSEDY